MKKQLLWGMLLLLTGLSSCQKDAFKTTETVKKTPSAQVKTNVTNPTYRYVDLVLQPRKTGENFDTYIAQGYAPAPVVVTNTPSWNSDMYPVLQNGVPAVESGVGAAAGYNSSVVNDPGSGSFVMTTGTFTGFNAALFRADVGSYNTAEASYEKQFLAGQVPAGTLPPMIWNYVNKTYDQPGIITTTGKIIRVTTGSHWAVATIDYPLPKVATPGLTPTNAYIPDPIISNVSYALHGDKGIFESIGYVMNGNIVSNTSVNVSATYNTTTTPGILHFTGNITRPDGSIFSFDYSDNPN